MTPIRIGHVGCAIMAQEVYVPNLAATPGCELVAQVEVGTEPGSRVEERQG